jgi:hypothetical protein
MFFRESVPVGDPVGEKISPAFLKQTGITGRTAFIPLRGAQ